MSQWLSITGDALDFRSLSNFQGKYLVVVQIGVLTWLQATPSQSSPSRNLTSLVKEVSSTLFVPNSKGFSLLAHAAYGIVHRARERHTSRIFALKQVCLSTEERQNGVPITALREISILRSLNHANIINVTDVAVGEQLLDEVYMVMEYAEQVGTRN